MQSGYQRKVSVRVWPGHKQVAKNFLKSLLKEGQLSQESSSKRFWFILHSPFHLLVNINITVMKGCFVLSSQCLHSSKAVSLSRIHPVRKKKA